MRARRIAIACLAALLPVVSLAQEKPATMRLHEIFDAEWQRNLEESPRFASHLGDPRYNDRWDDESFEAIERRHQAQIKVLEQLRQINLDELSAADKLNYRLFEQQYKTDLESYQYRPWLRPLNQRGGIQDASSLADSLRFDSVKDYDDWIARLEAFPVYMDQTIALMQEGVKSGKVHSRLVMQRIPGQIRQQIVDDPDRSLFYKPFRSFPPEIATADRQRLAAAAREAIEQKVVPAYRRMLTFFEEEYLPGCHDKAGVWQWPDGERYYAFCARRFTTTSLTPKEIHEIGQGEVRRIRAEMQKVIEQVEFKGTFAEFLTFLRTDPQFYFENPNDLLDAYRAASKQIDPQLVKLFKKLPRIPYGVEQIPMHLAPDTTTAYYRPPAADGSRAGTYFVNLFKPETRPKYEIEALSLHEAVPGHHLQIALAMELENVPEFRRYTGYTAYVEGWGLYAESLGGDLGLYRDPYSKFGQLTYEMWRAVRLVIDTGMHAFKWSRQEAIEFFAANTAKTMLDIENEVDRYIAWPGQALAYKIGELRIQELRKRAETKLGDDFDIREFHDVVLSNGAVPLDVLETMVDEWIAAEQDES